MKLSDPESQHSDFIKNLPKASRKTSFVDHMKSQKSSMADLKSTTNSFGSHTQSDRLVLKRRGNSETTSSLTPIDDENKPKTKGQKYLEMAEKGM
jgi:hypothetical protein